MKLDTKKSYGIKLCDFEVSKESKLYHNVKGREYVRIADFMGNDSTGNEIWVVV